MTRQHPAIFALLIAGLVAAGGIAPAHATTEAPDGVGNAAADALEPGSLDPSLAPAASVDDGGLQLIRSYTGNLSWSIDGLGVYTGSTGTFDVEKPAGATVAAAFLIVAGFDTIETADLADFRLGGVQPTFSDDATDTSYGFRNFFADVTTIVAPIVNAAPAGSQTIAVDEGSNSVSDTIEGSALVVIFDDPAISVSSIALYFGTSQTTGDQFELSFDALTQPQTEDLRLSIGSAFSYGSGQNSVLEVNGQLLTEQAGHFDDCAEFVPGDEDSGTWTCDNGALVTVGGVGDNLDNPVIGDPWTTTSDDELYSLTPFVSVGDSSFEVTTGNSSGDDNIFMAAFFLDEVELIGAAPLSAPDPELAATGASGSASLAGVALLALLTGLGAMVISRRTRRAGAAR